MFKLYLKDESGKCMLYFTFTTLWACDFKGRELQGIAKYKYNENIEYICIDANTNERVFYTPDESKCVYNIPE